MSKEEVVAWYGSELTKLSASNPGLDSEISQIKGFLRSSQNGSGEGITFVASCAVGSRIPVAIRQMAVRILCFRLSSDPGEFDGEHVVRALEKMAHMAYEHRMYDDVLEGMKGYKNYLFSLESKGLPKKTIASLSKRLEVEIKSLTPRAEDDRFREEMKYKEWSGRQ